MAGVTTNYMDQTSSQQNQARAPLPDLSIGESVKALMEGLPQPVRDFIESPARDELMREMTASYQLHFDQAAVFEREALLMLLGAETPEEFAKALDQDADLPPETVSAIMADLNRKVFLPIQEKMRGAAPPIPATPRPPLPRPEPAPRPAPPPAPSISFTPPTPVPGPAIAPIAAPASRPAPPAPANLPGTDITPELQKPVARTMQTDFPAGKPAIVPEPRPEVRPDPPQPIRINEPAVPQPAPAPAPQQAAAPPRLMTPPTAPMPVRPATPAPSAPRPAPLKQYGVDPYREPID